MRQGVRNGTVSVRLSICLSRLSTVAAAGCCCVPGEQAISTDSSGRPAPQQHGAQQHGARQQMRAVSRCQLT